MSTMYKEVSTITGDEAEEYWVPCYEYPNYEVSSHGNIRSKARIIEVVRNDGSSYSFETKQRMMKPHPNYHGYLRVSLTNEEGKKNVFIHKMVVYGFIGPCPGVHSCEDGGFTIDHIDNDILNNKPGNLRWLTNVENLQRQPARQLDIDKIVTIKTAHRMGKKFSEISRKYNIPHSTVMRICKKDYGDLLEEINTGVPA